MRLFSSILLMAFLIAAPSCFGQKDSFVLIRTYQGDIAGAAMDNLENLYIISSSGQLKKYNDSGDSAAVYNQQKNYGKLFSIDVTNPLKILLFYKDFSTVVVLDRFLSPLATLDLRKFSILQPAAIGLSYDNNIWVFDEYDNKLKKIDEQGNRLLETADFRSAFSQALAPQKIINDNGFVFLADSAIGIFVFDNYGSFKKKIPLKSWQSIAIRKNDIVSTRNELITVYNMSTLLQTQRKTPFFRPYYHSFASADKFVSFSPNSLQVYQYRY